ncbi:MAG: hypothetical protein ACOYOP_06275 [Microthrixaceae bacterium]
MTDHYELSAPAARIGPEPGGRGVPDELIVRAWWDPVLATRGHDPRSAYVERFWLGIVGPSTVLLLRRFARGLEEQPGGFRASATDTARALGLGTGTGRNGPLHRTIDRACTFGLARRTGDREVHVRTHLPPLNARQLARLPTVLRRSHERWITGSAGGAPGPRAA